MENKLETKSKIHSKKQKKRKEKKRKTVTRLDRFCNGRSMRKIINME